MGAKHRMDILGVLGNGSFAMWMGSFPLYWIHLFLTLRFSKNLSAWIRGGGNADLGSASDRAGNRDMVVLPVFMGSSFQFGSPAKIYGAKRVGDMGGSPMDQNLSRCGGALCHTFYGFISIKGERVMSKILIIDDDLEICSLVKRALEKRDIR